MKQLIFILFTFCVISNTYASTDCLQRPSCAELGYTQTRTQCTCFEKDVLPCPFNIKDDNTVFCGDLNCQEKCEAAVSLYDGQANTRILFYNSGWGVKAKAPHAALLFYVGDKEGDLGQGKWYLPALGEWMDVYGTDLIEVTKGGGHTGAVGNNKILIENALKTLADKGAEADVFTMQFYWSSNINGASGWKITMFSASFWSAGDRVTSYRYDGGAAVRAALLLKGVDISSRKPTIGDVVYTDKTFGAADDYDGTKTPAGIVFAVSENGTMVKILNLKDFTFVKESKEGTNLFDPENPYGNPAKGTNQILGWQNIDGMENIDSDMLGTLLSGTCGCDCEFYGVSE